MEDGELDFSNNEMLTDPNTGAFFGNDITNSFFDGVSLDSHVQCTHTHICNPPGPDSSHTHTCYHVHTKLVTAMNADDDTAESSDKKGKKKRPLGNREAVRKYREKKKARTASLEEEVVGLREEVLGLRASNQQLMKTIQCQDAEVLRLKCLLADFRGRIEGEIGSFPYQKQQPANYNISNPNSTCGYVMNTCNMQCGDQVHCLHPTVDGNNVENASIHDPVINGCEFDNLQCLGNQNSLLK